MQAQIWASRVGRISRDWTAEQREKVCRHSQSTVCLNQSDLCRNFSRCLFQKQSASPPISLNPVRPVEMTSMDATSKYRISLLRASKFSMHCCWQSI